MYDTIPSESLPSVIAILGSGVFFLILYWLLITQKINNNFNRLNLSLIMSVLILTPVILVTIPGGEDGMIPGLVSEDWFNAIMYTFGGYISLILLFFNRPEWLRSDTESEAKDRGLKRLNSERKLLMAALEKNGLDIILWKKLEVNLSDTINILKSESEFDNQEGREILKDVNIRLKKVQSTLKELSGIDNNYSNSGAQLCSVGTGGWGLGKCENQGIYQCPRCSKYCCNNHKSWVRTYQGEPVCEPCSRGMQHT